MTDGFDVLVQLVMAAITTHPFSSLAAGLAETATDARPLIGPPSSVSRESDSGLGLGPLPNADVKLSHTLGSGARSFGRFGPARLGSTLPRSSSRSSVNLGVASPSLRKRPCS